MPRFVLNCRPTGGASKRYLWVEKLLKESEKIFAPLCNT